MKMVILLEPTSNKLMVDPSTGIFGKLKDGGEALAVAPTILSFRKEPIDKVLLLQVQHQVSNRSGISLFESVEDPASLQEILQENLERLVRPQVTSPLTYLQSPL
ncbi:hypothetical protein Tco_0186359 [Tanacetum coccineum]